MRSKADETLVIVVTLLNFEVRATLNNVKAAAH